MPALNLLNAGMRDAKVQSIPCRSTAFFETGSRRHVCLAMACSHVDLQSAILSIHARCLESVSETVKRKQDGPSTLYQSHTKFYFSGFEDQNPRIGISTQHTILNPVHRKNETKSSVANLTLIE